MQDFVDILSFAYEHLYKADWQYAISEVYGGRAEIVEEHPTLRIGTVGGSVAYPKSIRFKVSPPLSKLINKRGEFKFNKKELFKRDSGICQYCEKSLATEIATVDHILPRSRGGLTSWENCVICCSGCNSKKGNKTPSEANMRLIKIPRPPSPGLLDVRRSR